ncbi:hypothetical protein M8C13_18070 [Crossiella sp. SN42]|uniref:hypothetical protein n=1 Tax=Crossiella sp. SN42 TaxID=2944808 RepID=UPI00207CD0D4|nr:hypothetical protein [Crossiella sp. SN42]MCO1577666.1 hypothetical protein [Crossiella sp. SN42]
MQVAAINARARQRYGEFVQALDFAFEQLIELKKMIDKMRPRVRTQGAWRNATPDELKGMYKKACAELEELKAHAMTYESELISRDWRV